MPVSNIEKDFDACTLTVVAEFAASTERVWQLLDDPRQLERWWGPPTHPATVVDHDLRPGGLVSYFMTDPDGEKYSGFFRVLTVEPPTLLEVEDHFGDVDNPLDDLPVSRMRVALESTGDATRMTVVSQYPSPDDMAKVVDMGVEEGIRSAMDQIDAILAG